MRTIVALCLVSAFIACNNTGVDHAPDRDREPVAPPSIQSITADEVSSAPGGYLAMAHLKLNSSDPSACETSDVVALRVASGVAPDATVASLCADQLGSDVELRACRSGERPIGDARFSSATGGTTRANGDGCFFCTSGACLNNGALTQRKEGTVHPCFPDFWNSCCYAINGGCCS
jgi:hypothetical protein